MTAKKKSNRKTTPHKTKTIDGLSISTDRTNSTKKTTTKTPKKSAIKPSAARAKKVHVHDEINIPKEVERLEALETTQQEGQENILAEITELEEENRQQTKQKQCKQKSKSTKKQHNKLSSKILRAIIIFAEAISASILIYYVGRANILMAWQITAFGIIVAILLALTAFKLIRRKTRKISRIIFGLLAIIFTVFYIICINYLGKTIGFLQNITTDLEYETQEYSVLVLKDNSLEGVEDLKNKTIAFQQNDPNLELVKQTLAEKITHTAKAEPDFATLMIDLSDNKTDAIVVVSTHLETIKENQKDFYNSIKVIYTFEIKYPKTADANKTDVTKEPFIVFISGSDSRGKISNADRSDVNMLAIVNPQNNKILLVSIPRDYYIQLHGTTGNKDKLTHAGIYGIDMSKNTLQDLFDVTINYTAKIGFTGVKKIVDTLDGIEVNSDTNFTAWTDHSCHFSKGIQHVNGKCALAYARERYAYASGDRHRIKNQQEVLNAIIKKATQPQYLIHYTDILASLEGSFTTSLSYEEITNFAKLQLNTMKGWQIENISVDGTGAILPTYSMGSQPLYVMIPNQETIDVAKDKINQTLNAKD